LSSGGLLIYIPVTSIDQEDDIEVVNSDLQLNDKDSKSTQPPIDISGYMFPYPTTSLTPFLPQSSYSPGAFTTPTPISFKTASPSISPSSIPNYEKTHAPTRNASPSHTVTPTEISVSPEPSATSIRSTQKVYYVSTNGDDGGPGTQGRPWRTLQKAADTLSAGDTGIILTGNYDERVVIRNSGESGIPITLLANGTVKVKGFSVRGDFVTIIGFDITDTDDHWENGWGIYVEGNHCVLEDNYIYFATRGGILLSDIDSQATSPNNCKVRGNRLYRNAHVGIVVEGRNNIIEGNEIWGTIQYHPKWRNPPSWVDADGMRFHGSGHLIRMNQIHSIHYRDPENVNPHIDCFQTFTGNSHTAASTIIIERNYCEVLTSQAPNESGHGFMLAGASNITIKNNIIRAYGGINTGGGGNSNLIIVNNLFANDLSFGFYPGGVGLENCPNSVVKNNIFYDQPGYHFSIEGTSTQGLDAGHNLVFRSDGLQIWGSRYSGDIWELDPLFVDSESGDFHINSGSPAIDAGESLSMVSIDFDGNRRPGGAGYDIGPYEYP
jgi:parallel beta-helix repeat protein